MKLSKQIISLQDALNKIPDEVCNEDIRDNMQQAWAHLEEVRQELEDARL